MEQFLFIYRRARDAHVNLTPADMQLRQQKWQEWISMGMQQGWLVAPGDALKQEGRVIRAKQMVTDGPFIESKELVGGYSIVQADSLDAAVEHAKSCPVLLFGASVEARCLAGFTRKT